MKKHQRSFRVNTDGTYRTETLAGQEYYVVPVIAMIQGTRLGGSQDTPELALASEFGKFPAGWNTTPIVMNHPEVDGSFVSAGAPEIIEDYAFGQMFNTQLLGNKLKTEAWLDTSRRDLNTDISRVFERVEAEEIIEVSVGFFQELEETSGEYEGEEYTGIWRNIVPDHLAFLPEGILGACSIEDGCGAMRNQGDKMTLKVTNSTTEGSTCGCTISNDKETTPEARVLSRLRVNSFPDGIISEDVKKLVDRELESLYDNNYTYVLGVTQTEVIYEKYVEGGWKWFKRTYSVDESMKVTLGSESQEIILMTQFVEYNSNKGISTMSGNDTPQPETTETPEVESTETPTEGNESGKDDENTGTETTGTATSGEDASETKVQVAASVEEYIENAPEDMRDMLTQSLRMHNKRKEELVTKLRANKANAFSEEYLKSQAIDVLEKMVSLAGNTGGVPRTNATSPQDNVIVNSADDTIPTPPCIFKKKETK